MDSPLPYPLYKVPDLEGWWCGPLICISSRFPGDDEPASPGTTV